MTIFDWLKENKINYQNKKLIENAFIHSSYVNEYKGDLVDNERLEFIGDAILQMWVSEKLYHLKENLVEGEMTTLRASLVCEAALVEYTKQLKLNRFLKLGSGEESSGGREKDSILADVFEAFLGAIYLDTNYRNVSKILDMVIVFDNKSQIKQYNLDYKTKLQEYIQSDNRKGVSYHLLEMIGPSNNPTFKIAVKTDDITLGIGSGNSKKRAEQNAAKDAFSKLVK